MNAAEAIIALIGKDQASPAISKVRGELGGLGTAGGVASGSMGKIGSAVSSMGGAMKHAGGQVMGLVSNIGMFAGAAGIGGIGAAIGTSINKVESLGNATLKLTQITGESAQSMSSLIAVGAQWGVGQDALTTSASMYEKMVGKLSMTVAAGVTVQDKAAQQSLLVKKARLEQAGASTKAVDAELKLIKANQTAQLPANKLVQLQQQYGVTLTDSTGHALAYSVALGNIADAYKAAGTAAEKAKIAAVASQVMGRGYAAMIPMLALGKKGLQDAEAEAQALGATLTEANMAQLASLRTVSHKWDDTLSGMEIQVGLTVIPALTSIGDAANKYLGDPNNRKSILGAITTIESVAGQVASAIVNIGSALAGIWAKIPGPMQQLLVGGIVANKAAGWLFGTSPLKAGMGVASSLVGNILGKVPGVSSVAGAMGLEGQRVFVTNWPMSLGGNIPAGAGDAVKGAIGAGGAAEVGNAGAMLTGGAAVAGAALSVGAVAAVAGVAIDQYSKISNQGDALAKQATEFVKTADLPALLRGQAALVTAAKDLAGQAGYNPLASAGNSGINAAEKTIADAIVAKQIPRSGGTGGNVGGDLYPSQTGGLKAVNQLSAGISGLLSSGKIGAAGVGMANSIASVFAQSTGPSLKSMTSAMGQLKDMQARYLAQGDTKMAAAIGADLRYVSGRVDAVTAAINAKQFTVAQTTIAYQNYRAGERGDATVKLTISPRDNNNTTVALNRSGGNRRVQAL